MFNNALGQLKKTFIAFNLLCIFPTMLIGSSTPVSMEDLIRRSEVIVIGEVVDIRTYLKDYVAQPDYGADEYTFTTTDFVILVDEVLKGEITDSHFTITSWGGWIDRRGQWASFAFSLNISQIVLIFAEFDKGNEIWWAVSQSKGVFELKPGEHETALIPVAKNHYLMHGEILTQVQLNSLMKPELTLTNLRNLLRVGN